ncbi:RDD family protein [Arthrobacter sp. H5]|uniref:RDD family protein n=1 Tax=Arthrobacter sp. H5 TaxID=1267973 RepID=UPI0004B091DF|nr:RDD family protein [Arthrobacter sp. H5]
MARLDLSNASAGKRLVAKLIDGVPPAILLGIAGFVGSMMIGYEQVSSTTARLDLGLFFVFTGIGALLTLIYGIVMWGWEARTGKTLGNLMLGLRTTNEEGHAPGWLAVFVRGLLIYLSGIVPVIGFVIIMISNLWDSRGKRQGWHDKAARTLVFDVRSGRDPLTTGGIDGPASFAPQPPPPALQPVRSPMVGAGTSSEEAPTGIPPEPAKNPAAPQSPAARPIAGPSAAGQYSFAPEFASGPQAAPESAQEHPDPESEPTRVSPGKLRGGVRITFDNGREVTLTSQALVGRNPAATAGDPVEQLIEFDDHGRSVSKTHLHLRVEGGQVWVTDRNSTNGSSITTPDGLRTPLGGGQTVLALPGATVHFGDRSFLVVRR